MVKQWCRNQKSSGDGHMSNLVPNNQVAIFASKFRTYAKRSVENTIKMAEIVYEAKETLTLEQFKEFTNELNMGSTGKVSKFLTIARCSERLKPYLKSLPHTWTTLYEIAKLDADQFNYLIENNIFHCELTAPELKSIFEPAAQSPVIINTDVTCTYKIDEAKSCALVNDQIEMINEPTTELVREISANTPIILSTDISDVEAKDTSTKLINSIDSDKLTITITVNPNQSADGIRVFSEMIEFIHDQCDFTTNYSESLIKVLAQAELAHYRYLKENRLGQFALDEPSNDQEFTQNIAA